MMQLKQAAACLNSIIYICQFYPYVYNNLRRSEMAKQFQS